MPRWLSDAIIDAIKVVLLTPLIASYCLMTFFCCGGEKSLLCDLLDWIIDQAVEVLLEFYSAVDYLFERFGR